MLRSKATLCVLVSLLIFLSTFFILDVRLHTRQAVTVKTECYSCNPSVDTVAPVIATTKQSVKNREYYASRIFHSPPHLKQENFTIVMMTYRRYRALKMLLNHYCKVPSLDRIVVVWNDVETAISQEQLLENIDCPVSILLSISKENKLTNRYFPREEIRSDCKLCYLLTRMGPMHSYMQLYTMRIVASIVVLKSIRLM